MKTYTLRCFRVDALMCLVHDEREPTSDEWGFYVRELVRAVTEHDVRKLLVVSQGGGPNAAQRKQLVTSLRPPLNWDVRALKTAVCTSSPLARGITVALGWLSTTNITGFGYEDRRRALDFLGLPVSLHAPVLIAVDAQVGALAKARNER